MFDPSALRTAEGARHPLVLTDAAAAWPAIGLWSVEHMSEHFGDLLVQVGDGTQIPAAGGYGSRSVRLRAFAEQCSAAGGGRETVFDRREFVAQAGAPLEVETSPPLPHFAHWPAFPSAGPAWG